MHIHYTGLYQCRHLLSDITWKGNTLNVDVRKFILFSFSVGSCKKTQIILWVWASASLCLPSASSFSSALPHLQISTTRLDCPKQKSTSRRRDIKGFTSRKLNFSFILTSCKAYQKGSGSWGMKNDGYLDFRFENIFHIFAAQPHRKSNHASPGK